MKKKIIKLGKKHGLNLHVHCAREAFDIMDYTVFNESINGDFIGSYTHYTGKTSTGVEYLTKCFLPELETALEKYKLRIQN